LAEVMAGGSTLQTLCLAHNRLTAIPEELDALKRLEVLDVR